MTDPDNGEWQCTLRIKDPELRARIASGEIRAFSFARMGTREARPGLLRRIWNWLRRLFVR